MNDNDILILEIEGSIKFLRDKIDNAFWSIHLHTEEARTKNTCIESILSKIEIQIKNIVLLKTALVEKQKQLKKLKEK